MLWLFIVDVAAQYYENFNLTTVVTPINALKFRQMLTEAGYDENKTQFLYLGFTQGFSLNYQGNREAKIMSPNLRLRVGSPTILWNKVMKKVRLEHFAGPYRTVLFEYFIQSPIGLVPKDNSSDVRLIFHLSYPKRCDSTSVNANTPDQLCSVQYTDFDEAVQQCLTYVNGNKPIYLAKSDAQSAFRILGLDPASWAWTVLKAVSPVDSKIYYFVDKCLPFGSLISCALFQKVSDAVSFLVQFKTKLMLINYLDDFLFVSAF